MATEKAMQEEADYVKRLGELDSTPLWLSHRDPSLRKPVKVAPHVWRWEAMRELAYEAGRLESIQGQGYRRALLMQNPGLKAAGMSSASSTKTMSSAIQIVWPGEIADAHRHTAAAIRFVIEGSGAFTVQDGERFMMEAGDLTLTPSWVWHDHNNPTDKPVIWLDCLDAPIVGFFDAMFQEPFPEDVQPITKPAGFTNASIGNGLMRNLSTDTGGQALPINYKWADAYAALQGIEGDSPFDGAIMEYANPVTAGHTMPTLALKLQRLMAGQHTNAHRHTSTTVHNVAKGNGYTIIDGKRLDWGHGDTFVVPAMSVHEHGNSSDSDDAVLFTMSDLPLIEAMRLYREEEVDRQEVVGTIG